MLPGQPENKTIKGGNYEKETDHSNPDVRDPDGFSVHAYEQHQRDGRR